MKTLPLAHGKTFASLIFYSHQISINIIHAYTQLEGGEELHPLC